MLNVSQIASFLPDGATARGGPWPPLQYASKPLDSLKLGQNSIFRPQNEENEFTPI